MNAMSSMSARDKFRLAFGDALTGWRLGTVPPRSDNSLETAQVQLLIGECAKLRLIEAYHPLLQALARIEARVAVLANLREDPYAPPPAGVERIATRHTGVSHE